MIPSKHLLVFKTSWRHLQDMSWRRLQHVFSVTILRLPRRLEDVLKTFSRPLARRLQDVLEDEKLLRWRRLEDVLEINKIFTRISVLIHGLLRNLNQYLTNLYLTNLYFTNLRRIQNALMKTQWFLYLSYFETQSAELFQNRHCRTSEAIKTKF